MESIQITNSSLWLGLTVWLKLIWFFKSQTMIWFQPIISCLDMFWTRTSDVWLLRFKTISLAVDSYVVLCTECSWCDMFKCWEINVTNIRQKAKQHYILVFHFFFILYTCSCPFFFLIICLYVIWTKWWWETEIYFEISIKLSENFL